MTAVRHDINHDYHHLLLKVGRTLGNERLTVGRSVLIRRTDQFNRGDESASRFFVVHLDLDPVDVREIDRYD